MEDNKETTTPPPLVDQIKEYAETSIKLAKYRAIEGGTSVAAGIIADVATIICISMAFIFASITLAFYLADKFGQLWEGFICVAALYMLIAIFVKLYKKRLERPIINALIQKILK
jgi:hypothetical protein